MFSFFGASDRLRGILLLVATAVLWSTSGLGIKWIDWNPLAIAGARSAVAAIVVWIAFRKSPICWNRATFYGAVAYAAMTLAFVSANKLTTAANAILLQYTCPIYVAVLGAIVLKEKPSLYDWVSMVFVGGGMLLFFQDKMAAGNFAGNLLAIGSGVAMAVLFVSLRLQKEGSPFGSVLLGNILTFLCGLPFMFDGSPGATGWAVITALGCVQLGLPYVLYSIAIKYVTALESSMITMIEPLLNPLWVFLLLGEGPGFWPMLGGGIILVAIAARYMLPALKSQTAAG